MARRIDPNSRYKRLMGAFELKLIEGYLDECGSVDEAASQLGISKSTLYRRMKEVGITREHDGKVIEETDVLKASEKDIIPREVEIDKKTEPGPFLDENPNTEDESDDETIEDSGDFEEEAEETDDGEEDWDSFLDEFDDDVDDYAEDEDYEEEED